MHMTLTRLVPTHEIGALASFMGRLTEERGATRRRTLAAMVVGLAAGACLFADAQATPAVERRVYFTAIGRDGAYVSDLTPADLTVREDGRDRPILRVEPSTTRLKICFAIDESLAPDDTVRRAALRFMEQVQTAGDVALYLSGSGNVKLADYTANPRQFLQALNGIPNRAQGGGNLVESLYQLAKDQQTVEGRRGIVIVTTEIPQRSSMTANGVLDRLRDSGAVLHAVTLAGPTGKIEPLTPDMPHLETMDEVERDRMLNEGPKQSGGLRLSVLRMEAFSAALDRIGRELLHQYVVTYIIPAGSKSNGRLSMAAKRKGVTLRAPMQLARI